MPLYQRVILKISGEALCAPGGYGVEAEALRAAAEEIRALHDAGVELGVVIGAGNIWRGRVGVGMDRVRADHMGMLATVINALAMQDALERLGVPAVTMSAVEMTTFAEFYEYDKAKAYLSAKKVVLFAAGTGNPFFTTDSCAALRAAQVGADVFLKATNVDGVYTADPKCDQSAKRYRTLAFSDALGLGLKVADATAFALCRENGIPILVFDSHEPGNMLRAGLGEEIGTLVAEAKSEFYPARL